jgi:hypothetical protein
MRNLVLVGVAALVIGGLLGFFIGRSMLEKEWSQPAVLKRLSAADAQRSKGGKDAALIPKEGSLILGKAPISRARQVVQAITKTDPVFLTVGDVGNGDEGLVLNLDLKNRGKCAVTALSGTAYGYDAYGKPAQMNAGGEYYVAFSEEKIEDLGPDQVHSLSVNLHHAETASLAVAHVDQVTCADGTKWARSGS